MSKHWLAILVFTLSMTTGTALAERDSNGITMKLVNSSDDVNFNIAADVSGAMTPNILSDLRWDDMEVWHLVADMEFRFGDHFKILGDVGVGMIVDGQAEDRDFLGDFETLEFSRATATVDGKNQINASVGFGWELRKEFSIPMWRVGDEGKSVAFASDIRFTPQIGYGYAKQEITFTDGIQIIPDDGPFQGLNSSFDPVWSGPFVGFDSQFRIASKLYVNANVKFWPWGSYSAEAGWNLRTDLNQPTSFKQDADSNGTSFDVGIEWYFGDNKSIGLSYSERDFSTDPGTDKVITSQGENLFTRLNEAEWLSRGWSISFQWRFGG